MNNLVSQFIKTLGSVNKEVLENELKEAEVDELQFQKNVAKFGAGPQMELRLQDGVINSDQFNETNVEIRADLAILYSQLIAVDSLIKNSSSAYEDSRAYLKNQILELETKIEHYENLLRRTQGTTSYFVESFVDNSNMEANHNRYYRGSKGEQISYKFRGRIDPDIGLTLPVLEKFDKLHSKVNGRIIGRARVEERLSSPYSYGITDENHTPMQAIDGDFQSFWLETVLSDAPFMISPDWAIYTPYDENGDRLRDIAGNIIPKISLINSGAACKYTITFDYPASISKIKVTPFNSFPMYVSGIYLLANEDELNEEYKPEQDKVFSPVSINQTDGSYTLTPVLLDRPKVFTFERMDNVKKIVFFFNQQNFVKNNYNIPYWQLDNIEMWNKITTAESNAMANEMNISDTMFMESGYMADVALQNLNPVLSQRKIDEISGFNLFTEYAKRYQDKLLELGDSVNDTNAVEAVGKAIGMLIGEVSNADFHGATQEEKERSQAVINVTKYEYSYGLYEIEAFEEFYMSEGVYISNPITINGQLDEIVFRADVDIPPSLLKAGLAFDMDGDGDVDYDDGEAFKDAFGSKPGDANWNERADLNGDGEVSWTELGMFKGYFDSFPVKFYYSTRDNDSNPRWQEISYLESPFYGSTLKRLVNLMDDETPNEIVIDPPEMKDELLEDLVYNEEEIRCDGVNTRFSLNKRPYLHPLVLNRNLYGWVGPNRIKFADWEGSIDPSVIKTRPYYVHKDEDPTLTDDVSLHDIGIKKDPDNYRTYYRPVVVSIDDGRGTIIPHDMYGDSRTDATNVNTGGVNVLRVVDTEVTTKQAVGKKAKTRQVITYGHIDGHTDIDLTSLKLYGIKMHPSEYNIDVDKDNFSWSSVLESIKMYKGYPADQVLTSEEINSNPVCDLVYFGRNLRYAIDEDPWAPWKQSQVYKDMLSGEIGGTQLTPGEIQNPVVIDEVNGLFKIVAGGPYIGLAAEYTYYDSSHLAHEEDQGGKYTTNITMYDNIKNVIIPELPNFDSTSPNYYPVYEFFHDVITNELVFGEAPPRGYVIKVGYCTYINDLRIKLVLNRGTVATETPVLRRFKIEFKESMLGGSIEA